MKRLSTGLLIAVLAIAAAPLLTAVPAQADTVHFKESLRAKVRHEQGMHLPRRGMLMSKVKQEYGKPLKILPTRGGSSKYQPPIHRWVYAKYIVYFEYKHVIHSVLRTPDARSS